MTLQGKKAELAVVLYKRGAIKFGEFKMKIHRIPGNEHLPKSPIYLDLRSEDHPKKPGTLTPEDFRLIGDCFRDVIVDSELYVFSHIADIPDAGDPYGEQIARIAPTLDLGNIRVQLRKQELDSSETRIVIPDNAPRSDGDVCLLVDDVVTGADTKLEAIKALEGAGYEVRDILAVVDRLQGGTKRLNDEGYSVYTVFDLDELLAFYVEIELIDQAQADKVMSYIADNQVQ